MLQLAIPLLITRWNRVLIYAMSLLNYHRTGWMWEKRSKAMRVIMISDVKWKNNQLVLRLHPSQDSLPELDIANGITYYFTTIFSIFSLNILIPFPQVWAAIEYDFVERFCTLSFMFYYLRQYLRKQQTLSTIMNWE